RRVAVTSVAAPAARRDTLISSLMSMNECCNSFATIHSPVTNVVCGKRKFPPETTLRCVSGFSHRHAQDELSDNYSPRANIWSADGHPKSFILSFGFLRLSDLSAINAEI